MKIFRYTAILLMLVSFTACGPRVSTTQQEGVDLSRFHTFAYLPNTDINVPKENQGDKDVNELIIKTINGNLQNAGYTINTNNPDLLVLVSTKIDFNNATTAAPVYASYPYVSGANTVSPYYSGYYYNDFANYGGVVGYDTDTYSYEEGTVIVDIINRKSKKSVWKGATSTSLYNENRADAVAQLVNEIFQKYPLVEN